MTLPPWVPLFSLAGAVVSDVGGVLSHSAIVARECGVPAVVGTNVGTTVIKTGQTITVDGNKGVVYLDGRERLSAADGARRGSRRPAGDGLSPRAAWWPGRRRRRGRGTSATPPSGAPRGRSSPATRSRSRRWR